MKIKLTLNYDGTAYCGWQRQKNGVSVQETVESAVEKVTGEKVTVTGSGRTDAGVHAKCQVACFDTNANIPPEKFYKALNVYLPPDIKAVGSFLAEDNFHPVKSAKKKTYVYTLYVSDVELPLMERYAVKLDVMPDVTLMKAAAKMLKGTHDFKCFSSTGSSAKTTIRTLYSVRVNETGGIIKIAVCGNGFLYNMVRIIVGTLVKVGQKKATVTDVEKILSGGGRTLGGTTFPAKGLCLEKVEYK